MGAVVLPVLEAFMSEHVLDQSDGGVGVASAVLRTGFGVETDTAGSTVVLRLQGELDMASTPGLKVALGEAFDQGPSAMAADLTELTFIDSVGIGALIGASRRASTAGCSFALRSPRRSVLRVLQLTGVEQLMAIETGPSPSSPDVL